MRRHRPGGEAEVDFGELVVMVVVELRGELVKMFLLLIPALVLRQGDSPTSTSGGQEPFFEGYVDVFRMEGEGQHNNP